MAKKKETALPAKVEAPEKVAQVQPTPVEAQSATTETTTETAAAAATESGEKFTPAEFETIETTDPKEVGNLQVGQTYFSVSGHFVTIDHVFNGADGLAHGHYCLRVDGVEPAVMNEKAVFNGHVTFWSPEIKRFLCGLTSEMKQQAVKFATATTGARSLFDLTKVLPSNYMDRGEKSFNNAAEKISAAITAVDTLAKVCPIPGMDTLTTFAATFADFKTTFFAELKALAQNNEADKAAAVAKKIATATSDLSIDAQLQALQAQIAALQAQKQATATA